MDGLTKRIAIAVILSMSLLLSGCAPFLYLLHAQCKSDNPCKSPEVKVLEW